MPTVDSSTVEQQRTAVTVERQCRLCIVEDTDQFHDSAGSFEFTQSHRRKCSAKIEFAFRYSQYALIGPATIQSHCPTWSGFNRTLIGQGTSDDLDRSSRRISDDAAVIGQGLAHFADHTRSSVNHESRF